MKKRILSVLLCLCMALVLLPTTALAEEYADDNYGSIVRVAGTTIASNDAITSGDVTYWTCSGNTLSRASAETDWNVKYEPAASTPTLTLKNFQYEGIVNGVRFYSGSAEVGLKLVFVGTNTIKNNKAASDDDARYNENHCIFVKNNLTITTDPASTVVDTLEVISANGNGIMACHPSNSDAARHQESIVIENASGITAEAADVGIVASKSLTINNSTITSIGKNYGLQGGNFSGGTDSHIFIANSRIIAKATGNDAGKGAIQSIPTGYYEWRTSTNGGWKSEAMTSATLAEKYVELQTLATYTVSFNANGGSGNMTAATNIVGSYTLPANGFTSPDGKQFKGWATGANEDVILGTTYTVSKNITLYAIWEDIPATTYTVFFNANGGSVTPDSKVTGADGKLSSLPTPTRSGYRFDGWYTAANGGEEITKDTKFTTDTKVYAHWTKKTTSGSSGSGSNSGTTIIQSAKTADIGVMIYGMTALLSLTGGAGVLGTAVYSNRKRRAE